MTLTLYINGVAVKEWPRDPLLTVTAQVQQSKAEMAKEIGSRYYEFCIGPVPSNLPPEEQEKPRKKYIRDGEPWQQRQKGRNREAIRKAYKISA